MYPYDHNDSNPYGGNRNEYYKPLVPQQRQPDENGSYHFTPDPQSKQKKGRSKAAKYVAVAAAMVVMSSAAGGGTAYYILNHAQFPAPAVSGTVLQTTNAAGGSPAADGSVAAVARAAADSVVEIDTQIRQQNFFMGTSLAEGAGSGVIISEDGYIVTNNHVVSGTESVLVRTTDGTEYKATVVGTDSQTDLAVLKVEATGLQPVTFADSDQIQVGDMAVAIGNPLGELGGTVTSGIISATGRDVTVDGDSMTLLQTSAAINPGNSGGGLFDANGHLIGVVNAKSAGVQIEGLGFAIPSNTVQEVVADIIDKGYVSGRPEMGITVREVNDTLTAQMLGVSKAGVYVMDPGTNEGLQSGDRFVFIDGQSIDASSDITAVMKDHQVGDTLSVTVERNGKAVETQVTLREKLPQAEAEVPAQSEFPGSSNPFSYSG